jgi:CHASE2 domain-containing sensor protein
MARNIIKNSLIDNMNANNIYIFIIGFTVLIGCITRPHETKATSENVKDDNLQTEIDDIVLVNAGESTRCQLGELISSISQCKPKSIGLNLLLPEERDHVCDSILRQSIITSDKVILVEDYDENGELIKSNKIFYDQAFLSGSTGLTQTSDGAVDYYYRLIDDQGKWSLTFPFLLSLQYDKKRAAELSSKVTRLEYPVIFYHAREDFQILDGKNIESDCHLLANKIVLIGYLGPDEENMFQSNGKNSPGKAYGTVITANIVLDILRDLK